MKKIMILFVLLTLVGCSKTNNKKEYEIKMYTDPSTSYSWDYEITGTGAIELDSHYEENECSEDICDGYEIFEIKGLSKGEVTIIFTSSEDMYGEHEEKIYNLIVDSDLNIKKISK